MKKLEELAPQKKERLIDLVYEAGFNISDWYNIKGGEKNAATNPRYCYQWAFIKPHESIILNLWHNELDENEDEIYQNFELIRYFNGEAPEGVRKKRGIEIYKAVEMAYNENLPIRVILQIGNMRDHDSGKAAQVKYRELDTELWHVSEFDSNLKTSKVLRGYKKLLFADQFTEHEVNIGRRPEKKAQNISIFVRDSKIRNIVLERAKGNCEYCNCKGFLMPNGKLYLETHHIIPLCDNGDDIETNIIALCPNHHKEAHYGIDRLGMQTKMTGIIKKSL